MASVPETIYNKFRDGDSLTDTDLEIGIKHFSEMGELLIKSGPVFRLAAQEALRTAGRLSDFQRARKQK